MPATPAWPPKSLPRLYLRQPASAGATVALDAAQANYLGNVLRLGAGADLLVFDGMSGEWLARIAEVGKKRMTLAVERKTREPESIPDLWLAFAPVKRAQTDWLVEKATELGAARLVPVKTQRTVAERVRLDRLESIAIEAAEQCGRTRVPQIVEPVPLRRFVEELDPARHFYFADESGGEPLAAAFEEGPAVILVGPEGGFTDEETNVRR
jgi:16S rRNA (uracil1498-N3)-methyltransferase